MRAIICETPGKLVYERKELPALHPGHALLKIKRIGICGTDIHAYAGNQPFFTYPRILGHELAGEVIEIDDQEKAMLQAGDQVVVIPYLDCGNCIACDSGKTNCCENIKVIGVHVDGGMQEVISVPVKNLIKCNQLKLEDIAVVEPLAIGMHAIRRANIKPGETVVVIGCGPIGLGIIKFASILGANVVAIDVNQQRLNIAKESFDANHIINANNEPINKLRSINGGQLAQIVIDATGSKAALESGIDYMCHGGRYVLVGLNKGDLTFNHPKIHSKESTIMCSRNATREDFIKVIEILEQELFPTQKYVTHKVEFDEMINQFDSWVDPENGVIKALVMLNA